MTHDTAAIEAMARAVYDAIRHAPTGIGVEMWDNGTIDRACIRTANIAATAALTALREHEASHSEQSAAYKASRNEHGSLGAFRASHSVRDDDDFERECG